MTGKQRRQEILKLLKESKEYQNATQIAGKFGISRQIIVSDIAILRAEGNKILSTPRGYLLDAPEADGFIQAVPCNHGKKQIREEFYTIVDNGGTIVDVIVEHPVYGQISASLDIRSRFDADLFIEKMEAEENRPLSALTGGMHVHRIATRTQEDFLRIYQALKERNIVCEE